MELYSKQTWIDHIVDPITGEILQQGSPLNGVRFTHIEDGIQNVSVQVNDIDVQVNAKQSIPLYTKQTILVTDWNATTFKKVITLDNHVINAVEVAIGLNLNVATTEQIKAWGECYIMPTNETTTSVELVCLAEQVPTINLPIVITYSSVKEAI